MRFFTKRRNAFWLSLAFALIFACAPMLAQPAPQNGAPPPPPGSTQPTPPQPPPLRRYSKESDAQRTIPGAYRLTYTLTEMDGTKRMGSQHYVIILDADAPPAHVDMGAQTPSSSGSMFSYVDTGLKMDASLRQFANGVELSTMLTQTELSENQNPGPTHTSNGSPLLPNAMVPPVIRPVIRRSQLKTVALLVENRPMILGQLDKPGSTHSLQVQVELSRVH